MQVIMSGYRRRQVINDDMSLPRKLIIDSFDNIMDKKHNIKYNLIMYTHVALPLPAT